MNSSGEIKFVAWDDIESGKILVAEFDEFGDLQIVKKEFDHMEVKKVDVYLKKLKSSKSKAQTKALRKQQKASRVRNRKG